MDGQLRSLLGGTPLSHSLCPVFTFFAEHFCFFFKLQILAVDFWPVPTCKGAPEHGHRGRRGRAKVPPGAVCPDRAAPGPWAEGFGKPPQAIVDPLKTWLELGPQQKIYLFAWLVESKGDPNKAKKEKGELILGKKKPQPVNQRGSFIRVL